MAKSESSKKENKSGKKFPSELRYDLISKDWVVIATGRGKRPEMFRGKKNAGPVSSKKDCPFCNIEPQLVPVEVFYKGRKMPLEGKVPQKWTTAVIPNKFPALLPCKKIETRKEGKFYQTMNACGYCELVVMRDHRKDFADMKLREVREIFQVYKERYSALRKKPHVNYVSIFHNKGAEAGASQPHPHSQIITTPLIDVDLRRAIIHSETYHKEHKKCIYCELNKWEKGAKKRVVYENRNFLAVCPFASKKAFEVIITPLRHQHCFESIRNEEMTDLADAFQKVMKALKKGVGDPPYNFYLHTAPCDGDSYAYYHWHWTILPKTGTPAGFEMGTHMEISAVEPEKAAEYLRKLIKK